MDFTKLHAVFVKLEALVTREPGLVGFREAAAALRAQSGEVAAGSRVVSPLPCRGPETISDPELARQIVAVVNEIPPPEEDESLESQLLAAQLLGNLVEGITGAVFNSYPELIPHDEA